MTSYVPFAQSSNKGKNEQTIDQYNDLFNETTEERGQSSSKIKERQNKYTSMVDSYYDLVTDFYEYGWGQSFHFAPRFSGESFDSSIARHEHFLAQHLDVRKEHRVLDMGCGVGGPMRTIARHTGATIQGITINDYQVKRANFLNEKAGLEKRCHAVKGNFMNLPFGDASFDRIFAIEATCHSPDKVQCFQQALRVLKPGGMMAVYEWCMTDKYDKDNAEHRRIKHLIEAGDALPDLPYTYEVDEAFKQAGFEVVEAIDCAAVAEEEGNDVGWWTTLQGGCKLSQIKHSAAGRAATQLFVDVLETLRLAPKGTSKTHKMLCSAAKALTEGGETGIFTPMYLVIARKPLRS